MNERRTQLLVEIALSIALAAVLSMFTLWRMPQGGSVSLSMLPLFVLALRRGVGPGLAAGAIYGFVDLLVNPYVVHWAQLLLDYPVAYLFVGIAGISSRPLASALGRRSAAGTSAAIALGVLLGAIGRYAAHVASGVIFFSEFAPAGQPVFLSSLLYTLSAPLSALAAFAAGLVLVPALARIVPPQTGRTAP